MNKKIAIISAVFALSVPIIPAFAQVSNLAVKPEDRGQDRPQMQARKVAENETVNPEIQERKELAAQKRLEFEDRKEAMAAEKCKSIESKIASRVNRYENNGQMLQKVYGNMKTRLDRLAARLKSAGADTTKLDADLKELYAKIDKMYADQAASMTTLKETQTFVCGKSEGEFKGKLEQARKVPAIIKQDRDDIKTFFQTTIKADLQAIRSTLEVQPEATEVKTDEPKDDSVKINKQKKNETTVSAGTSTTASSSTTSSTTQSAQ